MIKNWKHAVTRPDAAGTPQLAFHHKKYMEGDWTEVARIDLPGDIFTLPYGVVFGFFEKLLEAFVKGREATEVV